MPFYYKLEKIDNEMSNWKKEIEELKKTLAEQTERYNAIISASKDMSLISDYLDIKKKLEDTEKALLKKDEEFRVVSEFSSDLNKTVYDLHLTLENYKTKYEDPKYRDIEMEKLKAKLAEDKLNYEKTIRENQKESSRVIAELETRIDNELKKNRDFLKQQQSPRQDPVIREHSTQVKNQGEMRKKIVELEAQSESLNLLLSKKERDLLEEKAKNATLDERNISLSSEVKRFEAILRLERDKLRMEKITSVNQARRELGQEKNIKAEMEIQLDEFRESCQKSRLEAIEWENKYNELHTKYLELDDEICIVSVSHDYKKLNLFLGVFRSINLNE